MMKIKKQKKKNTTSFNKGSSASESFSKKSLKEKLETFIMRPQEYFSQYKDGASFQKQFIFIGILALISFVINKLTVNNVGSQSIISEEMGMEYAQEIAGVNFSPLGTLTMAIVAVLAAYIMVAFIALIYYVLAASCNGKITYKQVVVICSTAFSITILGELLFNALGLVIDKSFILSKDPYLAVLIGRLNPFYLWSLFLTFIGIRSITSLSKKKVAIIIAVVVVGATLFGLGRVGLSETLRNTLIIEE